MTTTDLSPDEPRNESALASYRSISIGSGWIAGRVLFRTRVLMADEVRTVEVYTEESGAQSIIVGSGPLRGIAVPVRALELNARLRTALHHLVVRAHVAGAEVHAAVWRMVPEPTTGCAATAP